MKRIGKKSAWVAFAALVTIGTFVAAPAAFAGTSGQWPNNGLGGNGIAGFNSANQGQVLANITGNNADGRCIALRSWNSGTPTLRSFFGDTTGGTMFGNSVFEVHTVDIVSCSNVNAVFHRLIIPIGSGGNYWQF